MSQIDKPGADSPLPEASARSMLLTVVGEFCYPHDDAVWTAALIRVLGGLGVESHAARQAITRAAEAGWLASERQGRAVRWRLTEHGRAVVADGHRHAERFLRRPGAWDGRWLFLLVSLPQQERTTRKRLYGGLTWLRMGNPTPGLWVTPHIDSVTDLRALIDRFGLGTSAMGPASATAVAHWVRRQPQGFRVYRYAGSSAPVAFMAILRLEAPLPEDRAQDPVIAALWDYVEAAAPLGQREHLGIRRFAVQPGWHQGPSPLMDLISRRTIAAEMRVRGRAVTFTVFEDAERWRRYLANAGLQEVVAVAADGRKQHVFGRAWRRQPVEQWVEHRARVMVAPVAGWTAAASAGGSDDERGDDLSRVAFEGGVVEALRMWHAPRGVRDQRPAALPPRAGGQPTPAAVLRAAITVALGALQVDPAGVKAHEALTATYIAASRTHKAAARRLGVPYGTYRRHLAMAKERLIEQLLRQAATSA